MILTGDDPLSLEDRLVVEGDITPEELLPICRRVVQSIAAIAQVLERPAPRRINLRIVDQPVRSTTHHDAALIVISKLKLPHQAALAHELTHLIAGRSIDPTSVLDEGLAVHLHQLLSGDHDRSFPTRGEDVHKAASSAITAHQRLLRFSEFLDARNWTYWGRERRLAYLEAGSFVRFLVERHGMVGFMSVYEGRLSWEQVFSATKPATERAWHEFLGFAPDWPQPHMRLRHQGSGAQFWSTPQQPCPAERHHYHHVARYAAASGWTMARVEEGMTGD